MTVPKCWVTTPFGTLWGVWRRCNVYYSPFGHREKTFYNKQSSYLLKEIGWFHMVDSYTNIKKNKVSSWRILMYIIYSVVAAGIWGARCHKVFVVCFKYITNKQTNKQKTLLPKICSTYKCAGRKVEQRLRKWPANDCPNLRPIQWARTNL